MGFTTPGRVLSVHVTQGEHVTAGGLIAEQEGSVLEARIRQVKLESESVVETEAAKAELAQREQELTKISQVHERGAATDLERERAELEVTISRFRVTAAEEKRLMATHRLEELRAERELLYLRSPVDGVVEKLQVEAGEAPQAMEPVVWIVDCQPLWIETPVPFPVANKMKVGDSVELLFSDGGSETGTVAVISTVADVASETVLVRIDAANAAGRKAGERVRVLVGSGPVHSQF
jgi:Multidrug resistance efflux pump